MGGGDLNLKKSWHPNTMKNQERVWKAEQKDTEERKRIAELQREINAERSKEDLQKFAEDTGVLKKKDDIKLEWMYKGPTQSVNHEDYLLGKSIDKNFEKYQQEQKGGGPSTSYDEEGIPGAVRQARSSLFNEQVDVARKMHEDPLVAIRQRAVEKAKQLYNNPVKMKQIQKLASMKASEEETRKGKDKKKKKKSKKSSKRDEEKMLDAILTEKLRKALKDRELLRKLKKKSQKSSSDSSSSSESDEDGGFKSQKQTPNDDKINENDSSKYHTQRKFHSPPNSKEDRRKSDNSYGDRRKSRSPRPSRSHHSHEPLTHSYRKRSRSRSRERDRHSSYRKEQEHYKAPSDHKVKLSSKRERSPKPSSSRKTSDYISEKVKSYSSKYTSSDDEKNTSDQKGGRRRASSDSDDDSNSDSGHKTKRKFGLMMADGSKPVAKQNPVMKEVKPEPQQQQKPAPWQRKEKLKLSDEEKERRRLEMLQNASWRDKEREENVKRYRLEEASERKQLQENFDDDFARKQFSKAADQTSVEGRIKSKLNTIQRSKVAMDQNFARR